VTQPIDVLRDHGLVDEDNKPRDDVEAEHAIEDRDDGEYLVTEIRLSD